MLPHIIRQSIRANRKNNIIYLNNPKVGCSTIKTNLWNILAPKTLKAGSGVHDIKGSPFSNALPVKDWVASANIFTFVRNPFTRAVSAYLNKIERRNDASWNRFADRYGLAKDSNISFATFIDIISSNPAETLDPHWRPQHINLMYPFVRPNFTGYLEEMDAQLPQVLSRFLNRPVDNTPRRNQHKTDANERAQTYFSDPEVLRMFMDLYDPDFSYFGYSTDITISSATQPVTGFSEHDHAPLAALAAFQHAKTPEAKAAALATITGFEEMAQGAFTRDWCLHAALKTGLKQDSDPVALVRDNLEAITKGHEFLRRSAASIAATAGEWTLCGDIADASRP